MVALAAWSYCRRVTMANWLNARWRAFQSSYDADEAASGSNPTGTLIMAASLVVTIAVLAYVPFLSSRAQLRQPWIGVLLTAVASCTTHVAWRRRCRGRVGTAATLVDSALWSSALVYCAVNASGTYALGLALANGLAILLFRAQIYSLTLLFGSALIVPYVFLILALSARA